MSVKRTNNFEVFVITFKFSVTKRLTGLVFYTIIKYYSDVGTYDACADDYIIIIDIVAN